MEGRSYRGFLQHRINVKSSAEGNHEYARNAMNIDFLGIDSLCECFQSGKLPDQSAIKQVCVRESDSETGSSACDICNRSGP